MFMNGSATSHYFSRCFNQRLRFRYAICPFHCITKLYN